MHVNKFPISETTLRQWEASTLENLHPPPLLSDVPNSPSISVHPVSWIPEEWPSSIDDLDHDGFVKEQPLMGPSPEVSLVQDRFDFTGDDDSQTQAPQLLHSGLKRKFVECDGDLDVSRDVPSSKRTCLKSQSTVATKERSPEAHHRHALSASEESVHHINSDLTLWPNSRCITASHPAPDVSVLLYPATPPPLNSHCHPSGDVSLMDESPSSSLQRHEIELSLPESLTTPVAASLHASLPNYPALDVRPQSAGSEAPLGFYVDNILDSSSDSSLTSDDSSCGSWAYLETLEPDSSTGAFVTLQNGLCQIPNLDTSNPSILELDPSDVEIDHTRYPQLERSRLSYESSETIFDKCKRKRLFIANEDEYEEMPCKRRSIEQ